MNSHVVDYRPIPITGKLKQIINWGINMKKSQLLGRLCAALCTLTALSAQAITVPEGVEPGQTYQLVFVTDGTMDALSSDIADYNSFVQAQAELNPSLTGTDDGVTYTAIGSTASVNANSNALVSGPVYLVDGSALVALNFADFWDGSIATPVNKTQYGAIEQFCCVWTGTLIDGTGDTGTLLGNYLATGGIVTDANGGWIHNQQNTSSNTASIYALSSVITAPVPVPAAVWLFGSGLLGLVGVARRNERA